MPPTPLTIHILLVLALGDNSPKSIIEQIAVDSVSTVLPDDSTFYKALHRMKREGLIAESPASAQAYTLTLRGRQVLRSERARYMQVAALLRTRVI
jgi:DNA-binding PadR family transcriptional regulator